MSAMRDERLESEILADLPPEKAEYTRARFDECLRPSPAQTRLSARDSALRELAAQYYPSQAQNQQADMINVDLDRMATRGHGQSEFDHALGKILELSEGKVLGRRQILNILCGRRTPLKDSS
jgi:hypothetical protein